MQALEDLGGSGIVQLTSLVESWPAELLPDPSSGVAFEPLRGVVPVATDPGAERAGSQGAGTMDADLPRLGQQLQGSPGVTSRAGVATEDLRREGE